jgi:predicted aspartyl protease
MSRRLAALALATLISAACDDAAPRFVRAPADSAAGEIRFRLAGFNDAALLVPVHINGAGPFDFVLDTGATLTCVDAALLDRLGIEPDAGRLGRGMDVTSPGSVQLLRIDSLRVGDALAADLGGCVLDLAHIQDAGLDVHGLLGLNFLKEFRVVLDFEREVLLLR